MVRKPNILVIHTDQHRFDSLGCMGNAEIKTPHIDRLAADGVTYDNSFCPYPVCTPSRYSLLSGLYVHQHLGWDNHCTLPSGLPTFPEILQNAGYKTTAVGKMHFTPTYLDVGFDRMLLAEQDGPGRFDDDYHRWLREKGLCDVNDLEDQRSEYRKNADKIYWDSFGAQASNLDEKHHSTTWIGDRAVDTINEWSEDSNLMMVGFVKPHHPFDPPKPWSEMYDPETISLPEGWTKKIPQKDYEYYKGYFDNSKLTEKSTKKITALYYATISQIDHHVGRMVEALKHNEIYDNTMIVFTSDHGEYLGFHHMLLKSNYMYDALMRVPLIIKYPSQAWAGTRNNALVNNIDIAPTIISAAGEDAPKTITGLNLATGAGNKYVFGEFFHEDYMIRSDTHKLLLNAEDHKSQFFDLQNDPLELNNLYDDPNSQPEIERLKMELARWALFTNSSPTHLDELAPIASKKNALNIESGHRENVSDYFESTFNKEKSR